MIRVVILRELTIPLPIAALPREYQPSALTRSTTAMPAWVSPDRDTIRQADSWQLSVDAAAKAGPLPRPR
jgi:hypothetical protein